MSYPRIRAKYMRRFEIQNVRAKYSHTIREVTAIRDRLVVVSSAASAPQIYPES